MKKALLLIATFFTLISYCQIKVVSDINTGTAGSNPEEFFQFKNQLYFKALLTEPFNNSVQEQKKHWKTDGTVTGTLQIDDLPITQYFYPTENFIFYFNGQKVVRYDGNKTEEVTIDLTIVQNFVGAYGSDFYFIGKLSQTEEALYKTDGTTTTALLTLPNSERLDASNNKQNFFKFNDNNIIIYLETETNGREPYISDGTPAGTRLLKNITANDSSTPSTTFHQVGNFSIFKLGNKHLWTSDGTETGTKKIKEFTGASYKAINYITPFKNKLYFGFDKELWETDGTEAGTKMVFSNINSDGIIQSIIKKENELVIFTQNGIHLFDGTSNTTTRLNTPDVSLIRNESILIGNTIYFNAYYKNKEYRIWTTDGTDAGTKTIKAVWPDGAVPSVYQKINDKFIFTIGSTVGEYNKGELWVSDGTDAGTKLLKDINKTGNLNSAPKFQTTLNGKVYFSADDNVHGRELFVYDGTSSTLVKDIYPGFNSSKPHDFYVINDKIIFKAYTKDEGLELWITDGTESGTKILKDINPNGSGFQDDGRSYVRLGYFKMFNNEYYFFANDGVKGMELWKTDGTTAGTVLIKDINPGGNSSYRPALDQRPKLTIYDNHLYFIASNSGSDNNLRAHKMWKTDGTTAGTVDVKIINDIIKNNTHVESKTFVFNNQLYFYGRETATNRYELFRTDDTNGTVKIADTKISLTTIFYPLKERIYYAYNDNSGAGTELWAIDKNDNIAMYKDLVSGAHSASPSLFYKFKEYFYINIRNEQFRAELWRFSDTTEPEKIIIKKENETIDGFFDFIQKNDQLFIINAQSDNNVFTYQMNRVDNTSTALTPVFTINNSVNFKNLAGAFNTHAAFLNDKLYFTGNIESKGEELLSLDLKTLSVEDDFNKNNTALTIAVYPNPVQNVLKIQLKNNLKKATIYNLLGKKLEEFTTKTIAVSKYKTGIYILKVEDEFGNNYSKKWIKQ